MAVKFGVFDQSEQPGNLDPGQLYESRLTLAVAAENAGFWSYHKSEHHLIPLDHAPGVGLYLAALAQRTSRIRLCSLVHLLPFYHPLRLVEEVCMLDHLSGGRFELGFGKGVSPPEHMLFGFDPDEAADRAEEALELLLAALQCTNELFAFDGRFWQFSDVPLQLKPNQQPYPPLWRPGRLERAAELGVNTVAAGPTAVVHNAAARFQELKQPGLGAGREPTVAALRKFVVAPTDAEADEIGRRAWAVFSRNLTVLFRKYNAPNPNDPTIGGDYERAKEIEAVVVGSPERIRAHVDELVADGRIDYVLGAFSFGDISHDEAVRSIELFAEHVVAPLGTAPSERASTPPKRGRSQSLHQFRRL